MKDNEEKLKEQEGEISDNDAQDAAGGFKRPALPDPYAPKKFEVTTPIFECSCCHKRYDSSEITSSKSSPCCGLYMIIYR